MKPTLATVSKRMKGVNVGKALLLAVSALLLVGFAAAQPMAYSFEIHYEPGSEFSIRDASISQGYITGQANRIDSGYYLKLKGDSETIYSRRFKQPSEETNLYFTVPYSDQAKELVIYTPQGLTVLKQDLSQLEIDQKEVAKIESTEGSEIGTDALEEVEETTEGPTPTTKRGQDNMIYYWVGGGLIAVAILLVATVFYHKRGKKEEW